MYMENTCIQFDFILPTSFLHIQHFQIPRDREIYRLIVGRTHKRVLSIHIVPREVRKHFSRFQSLSHSFSVCHLYRIENMNTEHNKVGNFHSISVNAVCACLLYVRFLLLLYFDVLFCYSSSLSPSSKYRTDSCLCVWMRFTALAPPSIQILIRFKCILRLYVTHFIFLLRITSHAGTPHKTLG